MYKEVGITFTFDTNWLNKNISDYEFIVDDIEYYFENGTFYINGEDEQVSYIEVTDAIKIINLYKYLFEEEYVQNRMKEYTEENFVNLYGDYSSHIKIINN